MTGEAPSDLRVVRYAFRLGWAVSELRGRYRPDRLGQRDPGHGQVFVRDGHELPLASERSPAEARKELIETVEDLGRALSLTDQRTQAIWDVLKSSLESFEAKGADHDELWPHVAHRFYELDAHIQDRFVLYASQATGYQLGRGLADTYWALRAARSPGAMGSWEFLFGSDRCATLRRLAARLTSYIGSPVLAAIDGPLESWSELAANPQRRDQPDVQTDLYRQGLLWRDLIRGERSTADLQQPGKTKTSATAEAWKELGLYRTAALSLKVPLIGAVISIVLLVAGASLLAEGSGSTAITTVVGILGALGLTSAGLYARAKAEVTSLLTNLSQTVETERIRQAANYCPTAGGAVSSDRS
jgi:hypothetical protein